MQYKYIGNSIIKNGTIDSSDDQETTGNDKEIYEVLRVEKGHPLFLSKHLMRWQNTMKNTGRQLPDWAEKLPKLIDWLIICNGIKDCDLRIVSSENGTIQCGFIETEYPTAEMYADGVACECMNAERQSPSLKIYHANLRNEAEDKQKKDNIYETILVNREYKITEGSRSNIYFIDNEGAIHTAPEGTVLNGIMRQNILDLCKRSNIKVVFELIDKADIDKFDSAFLSSTPMRILPIRSIDGVKFSVNNETLKMLMTQMEDLVAEQIKHRL